MFGNLVERSNLPTGCSYNENVSGSSADRAPYRMTRTRSRTLELGNARIQCICIPAYVDIVNGYLFRYPIVT